MNDRIKDGEIATITNNLLRKAEHVNKAKGARQCATFGIFGRNTASSPIDGRNAQT